MGRVSPRILISIAESPKLSTRSTRGGLSISGPNWGIVRQFLTHPVDHREYVVEVKIPIFRRGFCGQPTLAPEADPCAYVSVNRLS